MAAVVVWVHPGGGGGGGVGGGGGWARGRPPAPECGGGATGCGGPTGNRWACEDDVVPSAKLATNACRMLGADDGRQCLAAGLVAHPPVANPSELALRVFGHAWGTFADAGWCPPPIAPDA